MEFIYIIIGFALLIKASDFFVDASTTIAKIFNVSEIVIGATIVSIGTTLPETMVSATSAFKGYGDIAYGNAIGSIICNTALISAISLIFSPSLVNKKDLRTPVFFFFSSFVLYAIFVYFFRGFSRVAGFILVSIFIIYILYVIHFNKPDDYEEVDDLITQTENEVEVEELEKTEEKDTKDANVSNDNSKQILKSVVTIILSAIVIAYASNLLVDNGILIAERFGVPESVIGLTIIALGTSLPELSTAITSLIKGHSNLSLGNIIGANFCNIATVTGVAAIVGPFELPNEKMLRGINASLIVDVPIAFLVMIILCVPSLINGKTKRWQGIVLIIIYIAFLYYQYSI